MKLNRKALLITILVICGAWLYNLLVFMGSQIDKPLFFRQETYVNEDGILDIMLLQNTNFNNGIVSVQFPEISNKDIMVMGMSSSGNSNVQFEKMVFFLSDLKTYEDLNLKNKLQEGNVEISRMK